MWVLREPCDGQARGSTSATTAWFHRELPQEDATVMRYSFALLVFCVSAGFGQDWNQFRGPNGDGTTKVAGLPTEFSEDTATWKTPLSGRAWSSPVVWGNQVWLTNAPELRNPTGASNKQADIAAKEPLEKPIRLSAVCMDLKTGKVLHDLTVFDVYRPQFTHETNSYASPTPVIEEGRLYVHFGTYGTACIDTKTGKTLWERTDLNVIHWRGAGSSPVVHGKLIYLTFDGYDKQFVTALNKETGDTVWRRDRGIDYGTDNGDYKKAYSTPTIVSVDGRDLLVSPSAIATIAYDAQSGDPVWTVRHGGMNAAARPLVGNGLVYVNAGDARNALVAIDPKGQGDITESNIKWRLGKLTPKRPSQILAGENYFMIGDGGVAACLNAKTGDVLWKGRVGGKYWASPLYSSGDGLLYFFAQTGKIAVIKAAADEMHLVSQSQLDAGFNASPAIAGGAMILRSFEHVYRFDVAKK